MNGPYPTTLAVDILLQNEFVALVIWALDVVGKSETSRHWDSIFESLLMRKSKDTSYRVSLDRATSFLCQQETPPCPLEFAEPLQTLTRAIANSACAVQRGCQVAVIFPSALRAPNHRLYRSCPVMRGESAN
jgi:hypothetical protein